MAIYVMFSGKIIFIAFSHISIKVCVCSLLGDKCTLSRRGGAFLQPQKDQVQNQPGNVARPY